MELGTRDPGARREAAQEQQQQPCVRGGSMRGGAQGWGDDGQLACQAATAPSGPDGQGQGSSVVDEANGETGQGQGRKRGRDGGCMMGVERNNGWTATGPHVSRSEAWCQT